MPKLLTPNLGLTNFVSGWTWTGWDYRGEPTPYAWPNVNSHFGIMDLTGFWKDRTHCARPRVAAAALPARV